MIIETTRSTPVHLGLVLLLVFLLPIRLIYASVTLSFQNNIFHMTRMSIIVTSVKKHQILSFSRSLSVSRAFSLSFGNFWYMLISNYIIHVEFHLTRMSVMVSIVHKQLSVSLSRSLYFCLLLVYADVKLHNTIPLD